MIKRSFINTLPLPLKSLILDEDQSTSVATTSSSPTSTSMEIPVTKPPILEDNASIPSFDSNILESNVSSLDIKAKHFLIEKLIEQKGILFTEFNDIQLKLFDVDSTISPLEFDRLISKLDDQSRILLCEKIKLIYGFNSLTSFIIRLINILNFSTFFSIFDITSNIKLYGFYSLNYMNPVEILVKQIRNDLFIVKSFKEFTIQEMKKEHDFHLPYKEFKRLNLNDGNLVVVKILFKNEQKPIDLSLIKPLLPKIKMLHLSLENESKLKPFNDLIDSYGAVLTYLKFGVNRGTFKKIPIKNNINIMKLVNIDNLNFINDLKSCSSLDVFFDNWELRKNCDIKFQSNFIINFEIKQKIENLKILNIFHTYIDSKDLNKLKYFPNLTHSKISYVILDNNGFDMSECKNLQELKIHFTYQKSVEDNLNSDNDEEQLGKNIHWPCNLKKLSITIHNIKNLIQNFSIRLNILKKIAKPLPPSIVDLCIDISYDTGGSGPELYSISRDDILKISNLINKILTNNLENLKLKGISRYNYKIGKPLIFSAINFPVSLKLLSLNDFILDYNFINLPNLKKLYFEHSLFDSDFKLPVSDEILIEKCTFKDLSYIPSSSSKIEFKMCTFRKVPSYNGDVSNVVINNCRVMEQPTNNVFQFQQQLQRNNHNSNNSGNNNINNNNGHRRSGTNNQKEFQQRQQKHSQHQQQHHHHQQQQQQQQKQTQQSIDQFLDDSNSLGSQTHSPQHLPQPLQQQSQFNPLNVNSFNMLKDFSNSYSQPFPMSTSNFSNSSANHFQTSFSIPKHPSTFDYDSPNPLGRSNSDVNHFLNKELEFQLGNLSLNSAVRYMNGFDSNGSHSSIISHNLNENINSNTNLNTNTKNSTNTHCKNIPSPQSLHLSISSPPIPASDLINPNTGNANANSLQKRSDSFHNFSHNADNHHQSFSLGNQFNNLNQHSFGADPLDAELTRSSLGNLYENQTSSALNSNSLISSPNTRNFGYYPTSYNGFQTPQHGQQYNSDDQSFMSPTSTHLSDSRMSINGSAASMLISQSQQSQSAGHHTGQSFMSSRPPSQYITNNNNNNSGVNATNSSNNNNSSHLMNPMIGTMNNSNTGITNLNVFTNLQTAATQRFNVPFDDLSNLDQGF